MLFWPPATTMICGHRCCDKEDPRKTLRVIATVQDPAAVRAILAHLARSVAPAPPGAAPPAPSALT
jgi:hypothetical protein